MKSKRLMTIGIVLALLIAVVGVVLSVSLTACGKDVITVRSEKELLKAAGTSQEKTIVLMDDVVVNGDLKVAAPNKIDLNGFGLEVKGTLSADGSGTLVVGTTALILARRETVKAQKIDINMPQGHVEWNANIELPASAATSADAMTVVTSASSFVFKGVFKIGGAEADIMLTLKGGRFEISNMSESSAATVLVPEQAVGAAVENLSQGAMRVEAHSDVAVGGEVEISSKNSEVNVTALASQAETKITVTDGTVKKIDAAGAQVVVAESAQAGDVVAEKLENNGTVTGAVVADEIVNNGTLAEENVNAALKTAAKKALNDSFATYSEDDYTSDNWAKLTKAKDDGLAAIDSALTEAAIQSAKNTALDAMAAVETIAEATAEAKAAATAALKTAFEGYTETDYDAQTWATLKAAYDNGLAAIEAATDVSAVNTAKQTALDAMAACVPKDVEALTQAKAEAKAAIETAFEAYDEDNYTSANWTELTIAYNRGLTEVEAATSVSAVDTAKQTAITAMAAVKDNATLLADAKAAALAALDAAKAEYSQDDYATNWSVLEKAYNDGKTEINAAAAIEAVNSALQKATDAMAAVKNDATLLAEAKTAATDQLNSEYAKYKATDYTNANYELLTEKYNAGLSAIGGARTVDAVETALETAVAEMAAIKTNAQILADAKAAAKQAVNEAFAAYNEQDYTVDNWSALVKVKDDGLAAIEAAAKTDVAAEAGEAAIAAMAAVKNNATLLAEAKATAKSELETEYKKYKKTDYTANWSQLESAYNSGLTAIENAATIELAQAAKEEAVTAMAAVKNDATLLAEAKTAAKSELGTEKAKYSQSDYTINWSVLEQAYNDGLTAIDASKTTSAVDTAKQAAIAAMAAVKTDAEELEAAKSAAKDELKEYFDAFNKAYYYETSLQALQTAYDSGVSAISAAQSVADVATALANAKTALDNVKADVTEVNDADSLKAAVEAQYSKIILTANISGAYIEVNYDLTLDLNGFGLVLEDRTHAAVNVNGGASFTLCDGSAAKSGKIKSDYAGIIAIGSDADKAVVEINGGTIEVDNSAYWSNDADDLGYAVYADNAEVEMWGGEIIAKGQYVTEDDSVFGINLRNGSSATVHAGKIKSDTYGVVVYYNSAFTLDGGEITATWFAISGNNLAPAADITVKSGSATSTEDVAIYMPSQGSLTVSGGHIKGLAAIDARMGEIEISGGTLESTATEFKALTKKPGGVAVYDGSVVLFNVEMYVNDNTTSRPTGDGNNDFNAVVTGGTFVSAIEDGTYFSIYLWNTTTQSVTLGIDSQYGKIAWFDFVDSAVVNIVENCLADYAEEDYSAANWQAILDILDALETELATVTDVSQIEEKVSAAQAKMAEIAKAKTIATAEQFSQAVAEQKDGDEWRIGASFEVAPFEITSSVSVVGTAADVTLTVNADAHFVTIKGANIEVSFKNIALAGKIDYNGIYFDSAATGAKLTLDNTGISNVKRGVSIAADNASVVINSSEIVARYYGVTVGASGVELSVNGGEIEGATAIEMRAGKLVVNSGTMIGNGDPFESDPNGNGATTLGAAVAAVQHTTKLDLSVEINGGTLQGARAFYQANLQNNGKEALEKISITLGKSAVYDGEIIVDSAEATIEDDQSTRYYMTLQQAVDAAEDDETVVVVKDLSASGAEYFITLDDESKTVTVDLNGKTLLYTGSGTGSNPQNGEAISVSAGKLVLKNGTVNMVNDEAGGSVYWGIRVHGTGSLAMSKVTVKSEDSPLFMSAVSAGGKIYLTLDECYIEGVYSAVYMNGSTSPAEITINNSTIVSKDVGIYVSNSVNTGNRQKLTITDSTVTGTTAIEVKHTDATITGCTLIGTAEQLSVKNGNGSCTEGFAFAVTGNGDTDKTTGTVVVSGCKFYNGKPSSTDAEENGFYFVFTTAEGASVTVDGAAADETAAYGAYEARVSNAWFDTFENAVKYAEANGKTVVLLKDVEVGEAGNAATGLVVSGTVTVDFNGFTVSNVGTGYAVVVSGSDAKVTLIDSSKEQTGGIYGGSGGNNQALRVQDGAKVEIYGGNYNVGGDPQGEGNSTVAIRTNSTVNIYGGRFASEKAYKGKYFVLNVQQTTGASGFIKVYGGTFVGQNPADGDDALGGSFVAKGYEAFVSKEATDDSLAEYTVGKVYEAGSEEALRGAIAAAQGFSVVRLTADVDLKEELYINGVDLMLDLNGFTLSLHYGEGVKRKNCSTLYVANATLIINDSSEDKSGRVENTDTTGGTNLSSKDNNYAVRVGREANLIINGGTFYTSADSAGNGNSVILIYSTSSNESTVTINGGVFETEAAYNGTYFVLNVQDGFKGGYVVCGGTFKGYKPGTTNTGELATVPEGYEIAEQEIENGVVWYTVQKAQ